MTFIVSKKDVLDFWKANGKEATDHGTKLHEMQERYSKEFKILPEDAAWGNSIKHVASMFKDYYGSEDEACVYSKKYGVAGTMDKGLRFSKKSNLISIKDFKTGLKTNKIDFINKDGKFLLRPVSHLQDCKYSRYCLQVSIYGVLAEECAGLIPVDLGIIFIPNDPIILPYEIPVPYLRNEAIAILENFHNKNVIEDAEIIEEEDNYTPPEFII